MSVCLAASDSGLLSLLVGPNVSSVHAPTQVQEQKGLDIVRRDWCPLCKDVGNYALSQILSGRPAEDVVHAIHAQLMEVCTPPYGVGVYI